MVQGAYGRVLGWDCDEYKCRLWLLQSVGPMRTVRALTNGGVVVRLLAVAFHVVFAASLFLYADNYEFERGIGHAFVLVIGASAALFCSAVWHAQIVEDVRRKRGLHLLWLLVLLPTLGSGCLVGHELWWALHRRVWEDGG